MGLSKRLSKRLTALEARQAPSDRWPSRIVILLGLIPGVSSSGLPPALYNLLYFPTFSIFIISPH